MSTQVHGRPGSHARSLQRSALARSAAGGLGALAGFVVFVLVGHFGALGASGVRSVLALAALVAVGVGGYFSHASFVSSKKAAVGARSEERVGRVLDQLGATSVVHGALLGAGGDADHVVLGPVVAVVETKTGGGPVKLDGSSLVVGRRTLLGDPLGQSRRQAVRLGRLVGAHAHAVVCIPDMRGAPVSLKGVQVCSLDDLGDVLSALPPVLDPATAAHAGELIAAGAALEVPR